MEVQTHEGSTNQRVGISVQSNTTCNRSLQEPSNPIGMAKSERLEFVRNPVRSRNFMTRSKITMLKVWYNYDTTVL